MNQFVIVSSYRGHQWEQTYTNCSQWVVEGKWARLCQDHPRMRVVLAVRVREGYSKILLERDEK